MASKGSNQKRLMRREGEDKDIFCIRENTCDFILNAWEAESRCKKTKKKKKAKNQNQQFGYFASCKKLRNRKRNSFSIITNKMYSRTPL